MAERFFQIYWEDLFSRCGIMGLKGMDGILMAWDLGISNLIAEVDALEVVSLFTN